MSMAEYCALPYLSYREHCCRRQPPSRTDPWWWPCLHTPEESGGHGAILIVWICYHGEERAAVGGLVPGRLQWGRSWKDEWMEQPQRGPRRKSNLRRVIDRKGAGHFKGTIWDLFCFSMVSLCIFHSLTWDRLLHLFLSQVYNTIHWGWGWTWNYTGMEYKGC